MERSYFLGANTASGFVSLYSGFCRGEGDYLHIIKGGPGTGKSGFMRALGREAARRGYDIELLRCSGDPASLDGLYIPALRIGWVDGTAPHVSEPGVFGADCDYKNLGCFCRTPLSPADAARAAALNEAYKERYARAYSLLAAGEKLEAALTPSLPDGKAPERAEAVLIAGDVYPCSARSSTASRRPATERERSQGASQAPSAARASCAIRQASPPAGSSTSARMAAASPPERSLRRGTRRFHAVSA